MFEPIIPMHQTDKKAFPAFMETLQRQVSLGFDVVQVLRVLLHNRMRALDFYGKIVSLFLLCCGITLWQGVKNAVLLYKLNELISLDLFTYALPFICFILDGAIKRCFNISANYFFIIVKVLLIVYYLGMYVFSL